MQQHFDIFVNNKFAGRVEALSKRIFDLVQYCENRGAKMRIVQTEKKTFWTITKEFYNTDGVDPNARLIVVK